MTSSVTLVFLTEAELIYEEASGDPEYQDSYSIDHPGVTKY